MSRAGSALSNLYGRIRFGSGFAQYLVMTNENLDPLVPYIRDKFTSLYAPPTRVTFDAESETWHVHVNERVFKFEVGSDDDVFVFVFDDGHDRVEITFPIPNEDDATYVLRRLHDDVEGDEVFRFSAPYDAFETAMEHAISLLVEEKGFCDVDYPSNDYGDLHYDNASYRLRREEK